MVLNLIDANKISFRENSQLKENKATTPIKSGCEKSPETDTFDKQKDVNVNSSTEKKGMSKGAKWLLGLASAGALAIIAFFSLRSKKVSLEEVKKVSFDDVQKALSEIFEKDFSKEEADVLVKKYTEIYKEHGSNNYFEKLVEQLKKDYGIENVNTKLEIDNAISNNKYLCPGETRRDCTIVLRPQFMKESGDKYGFNTAFHELKHVRQFSELWSADSELLIKKLTDETMENEATQEALQESLQAFLQELQKEGITGADAEKMAKAAINKNFYDVSYNTLKETLEPVYKNLQKFPKDSPEYNRGVKYLDSLLDNREIIPTNDKELEAYKNLLCEKEAYKCGENAEKLLKYIQQNSK